MEHVIVDEVSGCWNWQGNMKPNGYGRLGRIYAHRVYYTKLVGPIPGGLEIDHLCRNRGCVNPDHLEAVTPQVNKLRSDGVAALNARKTHCYKGHEFTPENTRPRVKNGLPWRECRECSRLQGIKGHAAKRARDAAAA